MSRLGKEKACEIHSHKNRNLRVIRIFSSLTTILIATGHLKIGALDTLIC